MPALGNGTYPTGFNDSGPLNVTLQANTYYLIAESLSSGAMYYTDQSVFFPLSFATVLKAAFQSGTFTAPSSFAPIQSALIVQMRLTTALP